MAETTIEARAWQWMGGHDRGLSSEAIWARMMGAPAESRSGYYRSHWDHPWDASDFGRCSRLLEFIPEWRPRLGEMAALSPEWARLVERWDDIQRIYAEGIALPYREQGPLAHACYDLIKECIKPTVGAAS